MKNKTLMARLVEAGYPEKDFFHHGSDLYIYKNDLTTIIINEWLADTGYKKDLFVSTFTDHISGATMFDIAFQYTPFWEGKRG